MQKSKSENQLVLEAAGPTDPALQATGPAVAGSAVAGPAPVQVAENQLVPEVAGPATGPTVPVQQANQSGTGPTVPAVAGSAVAGSAVAGPAVPAVAGPAVPAVAGPAVPAPVEVAENQLVPEVAGPATGPTVPVPVQQANQSGSGSATVPTVPAPENQSGTPPVIIGRPVTELSSDSQIVQGKIIQATGPAVAGAVTGPAVAGAVTGPAVAGAVTGPAVAGAVVAGPAVAVPATGPVQQANQSGPEGEGAEMVAVAVLATATKVGVKQDNPVNPEPKQNTRIKTLFLDNLHLFFGDTHLVPIKNFINPSHELIESRRMSGMNEFDREDYEHDRLIKLLKTMFFRESNGIVSKVFVGGGITIDQLKKKIKKGISLIVPKY